MKLHQLPKVIEFEFPKKVNAAGMHSDIQGRPPGKRPGTIRVDPRLTPRDYFECLIHEGLHEFAPYLDEWAVQEIGDKMERFLTREGYRRIYQLRESRKRATL